MLMPFNFWFSTARISRPNPIQRNEEEGPRSENPTIHESRLLRWARRWLPGYLLRS